MKKAFSIGLAVLIVLFVATTGLSTEDSLAEVKKVVDATNATLFGLIEAARSIARDTEQDYTDGSISNAQYRTTITDTARWLIQETEKLVQEARLFALSRGVKVKCYRVMVELSFMKISVDPLVVCDD